MVAECRGKRWQAIRKAADPLFHANAMKSYMPIFKLAVQRFLTKLEQSKPGETLEIVEPMKDLGLEVIGATVFGWDPYPFPFPPPNPSSSLNWEL